jgi:hypothetical protein
MGRVLLGFLFAALAYPAFVALASPPGSTAAVLRLAAVTGGGVLLVGLPAFLLFRCRGWWQLWRFLAGGGLGGLLLALALLKPGATNAAFLALVFTLGGVAHALLFWVVAVWRNRVLTLPREYCLPGGLRYKVARRVLRPADTQTRPPTNEAES